MTDDVQYGNVHDGDMFQLAHAVCLHSCMIIVVYDQSDKIYTLMDSFALPHVFNCM